MKELSRIALKVNPSTTLAIDSIAKQMKADGMDVIGFGTGEPDFMTPDNISEAVRRCMPFGVDLSSAVETDGKKDREKIMAAVAAVRSIVI